MDFLRDLKDSNLPSWFYIKFCQKSQLQGVAPSGVIFWRFVRVFRFLRKEMLLNWSKRGRGLGQFRPFFVISGGRGSKTKPFSLGFGDFMEVCVPKIGFRGLKLNPFL